MLADESNQCFICRASAVLLNGGTHSNEYKCKKCGNYSVSDTLVELTDTEHRRDHLVNLRGWVRDRNVDGTIPSIDSENFDKIIAGKIPNVSRRLEILLIALTKRQKYIGEFIESDGNEFLGISYSATEEELFNLMQALEDKEYVKYRGSGFKWYVTVKGFMAAEGFLDNNQLNSNQAFVAMSFDKEMVNAYTTGIEPAISSAGYVPFRVDQHDHINHIDDEIIAQIRRSKFLVADMTGQRGGVYFEAGFAYGLGVPVIYTCRDNDFKNLHFDIRQINCIKWKNFEDLQVRLENRIKAVIV